MGATDDREMLEAAKQECARLEGALVAIRELMDPIRVGRALSIAPEDDRMVTRADMRAFIDYSMARTAQIRTVLAGVGYPVVFPTTESETKTRELVAQLATEGVHHEPAH